MHLGLRSRKASYQFIEKVVSPGLFGGFSEARQFLVLLESLTLECHALVLLAIFLGEKRVRIVAYRETLPMVSLMQSD